MKCLFCNEILCVCQTPSFVKNEPQKEFESEPIAQKYSFDSKRDNFVDPSINRHKKFPRSDDINFSQQPSVHISSSFPSRATKLQAKPFLPFQEYISVVKEELPDCATCSKIPHRPPSEPNENSQQVSLNKTFITLYKA